MPSLMDRAIGEINDLGPDLVICTGDLTTFGFKQEFAQAKSYLDRLECEVARRRARKPRLAERRVRPLRAALRRPQLGAARRRRHRRRGRLDRAGPRSRPDRARPLQAGSRSSSARSRRDLRIFVLHHHLLPVPGTGRERNVVYDAGDAIECLQRAGVDLVLSGHKHVPYAWRLEDLFIVNTGTVSSLRLRGQHEALLQRRRDQRGARGRLAQVPVPRPGADHPVLDRHAVVREVHGANRVGGDDRTREGDRAHRRRAPRRRGARRARRAAVRVRRCDPRRRHGEARTEARTTACGSSSRSTTSAPRPWSTSRTSRCSGRASGCAGRARRSRAGFGTSARTSSSARRSFSRARRCRRSPWSEPGKRIGKTAVTGHVARLLAERSEVVVVSMGRGGPPEPEIVEVQPTLERLLEISRAGRPRCFRLPGDGCARRRPDDRLPARRRRLRRRGVHVEPAPRRRAGRGAQAGHRGLRRQRRGDSAGLGQLADPRRRARPGRDRVPQSVPGARSRISCCSSAAETSRPCVS